VGRCLERQGLLEQFIYLGFITVDVSGQLLHTIKKAFAQIKRRR
jgi:hypothetical protein